MGHISTMHSNLKQLLCREVCNNSHMNRKLLTLHLERFWIIFLTGRRIFIQSSTLPVLFPLVIKRLYVKNGKGKTEKLYTFIHNSILLHLGVFHLYSYSKTQPCGRETNISWKSYSRFLIDPTHSCVKIILVHHVAVGWRFALQTIKIWFNVLMKQKYVVFF